MLCTFRCANGLKCLISGQKPVKDPPTLAQSAQTDKRYFFFLLEQLELVRGAVTVHFSYTEKILCQKVMKMNTKIAKDWKLTTVQQLYLTALSSPLAHWSR